MTTQPNPGRRCAGLAALLHEGRGHGRLYDTYAPQLYRYCWTLLGPDGADEAVYETLLSAVQLFDHLEDHSDLRPWLFALARSASQRRGFSPASPYAQLATIPGERPVVEMALRLPPSQRELLELYLRHGLSPSQIARILGLDTDITGELCRAAVRRAADVCTEQAPNDDHGTTGGSLLDHTDVSELLALLEPPDPPEGLRDRVLRGCTDPLKAAERQELGVAMAPLGGNGFPLHRDRSEQSGAPGQEPPSGGPETAPAGHGNTGEEPAIPRPTGSPRETSLPGADRSTSPNWSRQAARRTTRAGRSGHPGAAGRSQRHPGWSQWGSPWLSGGLRFSRPERPAAPSPPTRPIRRPLRPPPRGRAMTWRRVWRLLRRAPRPHRGTSRAHPLRPPRATRALLLQAAMPHQALPSRTGGPAIHRQHRRPPRRRAARRPRTSGRRRRAKGRKTTTSPLPRTERYPSSSKVSGTSSPRMLEPPWRTAGSTHPRHHP